MRQKRLFNKHEPAVINAFDIQFAYFHSDGQRQEIVFFVAVLFNKRPVGINNTHFLSVIGIAAHVFLQQNVVKQSRIADKRYFQIKTVVVQNAVFADAFKRHVLAAVFKRAGSFYNFRPLQLQIVDAAVNGDFITRYQVA